MADSNLRIREFAASAGVTVRALHHYDRLGLLKPRRTEKGYRVYGAKDLETLEQIVALKFIGLPLRKIKTLLRRNPALLSETLRTQRTLIEQKKILLERAIAIIREAETTLEAGGAIDSAAFRHIIEVIEMQNKSEEWNQKYDALVQGKIERLKSMSPETKAQLQARWAELFKDIEEALGEDPSSAKAQQLADRWATLLGAFNPVGVTPDPQLLKTLGAAYASGAEWPAGTRKPEGPFADRRVWDFMRRALAARP
jgi:DNA-binding transcriptional MerR regulator